MSVTRFTSVIDEICKTSTTEWFRAAIDIKPRYILPPAAIELFPAVRVPPFDTTARYIVNGDLGNRRCLSEPHAARYTSSHVTHEDDERGKNRAGGSSGGGRGGGSSTSCGSASTAGGQATSATGGGGRKALSFFGQGSYK